MKPEQLSVDICVITTIHQAWDARVFDRCALELAEQGKRVCLVAPWPDGSKLHRNITHVRLPTPVSRFSRLAHGLRTYRTAQSVRASVYIFHDLDFLPFAVRLAATTGKAVVYDCHENYPEEIRYQKEWIPRLLRPLLSALVRTGEGYCVRRMSHVIAAAPSVALRLRAFTSEITLVRNLSRYQPAEPLSQGENLVCIGSISPSYGLHVLLGIGRILKARGSSRRLIVTDRFAEPSQRKEFTSAIALEALPIDVLPRVAPADIGTVLEGAGVGLAVEQDYPAKRLAIPTKIYEYLAHGLPVVASDLPGTRSVLEHVAGARLVDPDDPLGYVEAAEAILNSSADHAAAAAAARNASDLQFNWKTEARVLLRCIEHAEISRSVAER